MTSLAFLAAATAGACLCGASASAQGIAIFGDARLGLGYNIDNDGGVLPPEPDGSMPDDLRAVSRVRFGVTMTGETDSGMRFGAEIRADNAPGGEGGTDGQTEGSVFVSGAWGTLTMGDTEAADEQWVGDVPGNYSLTGLTDVNETRFISNGGSFGNDTGEHFAENPFARPTVRYDLDLHGLGLSLSTNRTLDDVAVGAGYAADFAGGTWTVGAGYYKFASFSVIGDAQNDTTTLCGARDPSGACTSVIEVVIPVEPVTSRFPTGEQWSFGFNGEYRSLAFGVTYTTVSGNSSNFGNAQADNLLLGGSASFGALSVGGFYGKVLHAKGSPTFQISDGDAAYGVTAQYDLGAGATVNGGIVRSYAINGLGAGNDSATIADFGISMNF